MTPDVIVAAIIVGAVLLLTMMIDRKNVLMVAAAFGAGLAAAFALLILLPERLNVNSGISVWVVVGLALAVLLRFVFAEREAGHAKKAWLQLSAILAWLRVAVLGLLLGAAMAMRAGRTGQVALLAISAVCVLVPEAEKVVSMFYAEGARKFVSASRGFVLAIMPLVAVVIASMFPFIPADYSEPFVGVAIGVILLMSLGRMNDSKDIRTALLAIAGSIAGLVVGALL
jgi:hypothetical protein